MPNQTIRLKEQLTDCLVESDIDASARIVKNVALTGCESRNGYRYTESALRSAVPLYVHKPVFLDHAAAQGSPGERSTRDLVGSVENVRYDSGRIRGDIRVLATDSGKTFLALTESDAPGLGMSHVVLAKRSADGKTIEQITEVISVDAVINPATTTTFHESLQTSEISERTGAMADVEPGSPAESVSQSEEGDDAKTSLAMMQEELAALRVERNRILRQLEDVLEREQQRHQSETVEALLVESRLPAYAITPSFRKALLLAADETARRELIQERAKLIRRASLETPRSKSRESESTCHNNSVFVATIKRCCSRDRHAC